MLLEYILQERDIEEEDVKWVNVELDSGQKRMLVVLQIGDGISNSVKDTSTKRAIIIAFVDDIPENYCNLQKMCARCVQGVLNMCARCAQYM